AASARSPSPRSRRSRATSRTKPVNPTGLVVYACLHKPDHFDKQGGMTTIMTRLMLPFALLAAAALAAGCGSSSDAAGGGGGKLSLVAYSTPKEAYAALIPAFQKTAAGKGAKFTESYGSSGDQSRAVDSGLEAAVVAFSLEPDVTRLVKDGIVDASWNANAHKGIVTDSVVVLAVRNGNPKGIRTFEDLAKPG